MTLVTARRNHNERNNVVSFHFVRLNFHWLQHWLKWLTIVAVVAYASPSRDRSTNFEMLLQDFHRRPCWDQQRRQPNFPAWTLRRVRMVQLLKTHTHWSYFYFKKQIQLKKDMMTYEVVSENVERHCVNLICSLNCHSMKHWLLLLLSFVPNHFFHYPTKAKKKISLVGIGSFCWV